MRIGLLGACSERGGVAARVLLDAGVDTLCLGARDPRHAAALAAELGTRAPGARIETVAVDPADAASLLTFAAACGVLVNCAGPAHSASRQIALAAVAAGVDLIDTHAAPESAPLFEQAPARTALFGTGMQPGLTALLPRWLAEREFARVTRLRSYLRVFDRLSIPAARDLGYLADTATCTPLAVWRSGPRRGALARRSAVELSGVEAPSTLLPYLDPEATALAAWIGLEHGDWFSMATGPQLLDTLDPAATGSIEHHPRSQLLVELVGLDSGGRARTRCALLDGGDSTVIGATLIALATLAVVAGAVRSGAGFAALALDPERTLADLSARGVIEPPQQFDGGIEDCAQTERVTS
ncbi:hypothetical protein MARPU_08705 [Marichromatium purpuratum 984]|uniref:Saccharopine dehydrogenase NADP binding domain-containing protein n=1 Tax=Marichromatium purpuratum 984 TaxID=765910 RepID=W0E3Y4_MARPU|nr:saccharopine dehydrogenase NADP-binding domain-containing protein [Marichromatium purpuratum]AHF03934.1 hypothetical protein MARPU_08705 [Marichromatium purpuratum 984]